MPDETRWQLARRAMAARWPALIRALPEPCVMVRQGGAVGLADRVVVLRQDWLAQAPTHELHHALLHLAAHATLGHRTWRWHPAAVDARLDVEATDFLVSLGVPPEAAGWHDDHHGIWADVPVLLPGESLMARAEPEGSTSRDAAASRDMTLSMAEDDSDEPIDFDAQQAAKVVAARQSTDGRSSSGFKGSAGTRITRDNSTDWRAVLELWLVSRVYQRWQFDRPSRRQAEPFILPRLAGKRLNLVLALDVSGSIDPAWARQFLFDAEQLRGKVNMQLRLLTCDNRIHDDRILSGALTLPETGGGGTDFRPVFSRLHGDSSVDALVYCTDLIGQYPEQAPHFPVFWLVPSALLRATRGRPAALQPPPFGRVLPMIDRGGLR
ncbi:VWA-like domain-containing protein [Halothiobacillus sp.]|uniref:VWA-like domain-containing protein n=1 Tax=Halothiobacillus sp. TaxID=1891311 RepID=UPI002615C10D|nr:VWA-like domain-containing protein [Halothiobacillus sp.]MDD4966374.1 VWA-like domain-containing protein [Halothiobacillus sp.]